jgi:hypothetical protein
MGRAQYKKEKEKKRRKRKERKEKNRKEKEKEKKKRDRLGWVAFLSFILHMMTFNVSFLLLFDFVVFHAIHLVPSIYKKEVGVAESEYINFRMTRRRNFLRKIFQACLDLQKAAGKSWFFSKKKEVGGTLKMRSSYT